MTLRGPNNENPIKIHFSLKFWDKKLEESYIFWPLSKLNNCKDNIYLFASELFQMFQN